MASLDALNALPPLSPQQSVNELKKKINAAM
jgi:hypothetical protein